MKGYRTLTAMVAGFAAVISLAAASGAQSNSGASDLLLPIGARAVGMGASNVAEQGGDGAWWNPAGLARLTKPEFSFDHFATVSVPSGDAIALVLPAGVVGVFAISARRFSFCKDCAATDSTGQETGVANLTADVVGVTFAARFGPKVSAGITGRIYQYSDGCSGACSGAFSTPTNPSTTGFLDFGLQYRPSATSPLQAGLLLTNWGRNLQVNNQEQADPLPTRLHLGISYRPTSSSWDPALRVRLSSELVATPTLSAEQELHAGAEVGYVSGNTALSLRGGYVHAISAGPSSSFGPSLGFGIASGRVQLDVARIFDSFSPGLGSPPTYVSIRVGL
ncbi:MAG: hypothetical protein JWM95_3379 [Gemmatimonadetes bacterium]|nr:hypothetical protein [Gemmatimonadota bacterium]